MVIRGKIYNIPVKILLDSGATDNFINPRTREALKLRRSKPSGFVRPAFGGGMHTYLIPGVPIRINKYEDRLDFHETPMRYDLVLGIGWHRNKKIQFDWDKNAIHINHRGNNYILQAEATVSRPETELPEAPEFLSSKQLSRAIRKKKSNIYYLQAAELHSKDSGKVIIEGTESLSRKLQEQIERMSKDLTGLPPSRPGFDHEVKIIEGAQPAWKNIYHMTESELKLIKEEITRLTQLGFIRKSTSAYSAPIFFVEQKDKIRPVIDYRALNKITVRNRAAIPNMKELLNRLRYAKVFSKLDLQSGFHQIRVKEEDIHKTAFGTKYGHYEWTVMPFGMQNSPATFQSLMNHILREFIDDFVLVYVDDVLIYSPDEKQHEIHLKKVLDKLEENQMRIRGKKCSFMKSQIKYLGFEIGNGQIKVEDDRIKAIQEWNTPRNTHELRSFLGLANTIHPFIKNYASLAAPLNELLKGSPERMQPLHVWNEEHEKSFQDLKNALTSPEVLTIPDDNGTIILHTDYSKKAVGGWISQQINGNLRPIAFESRKLKNSELNYSTYDGELLAIKNCLEKFRPYLRGRPIILRTDQSALKWILEQPQLNKRQARSIELMLEFDICMEWIKGKMNHIADVLSRYRGVKDQEVQVELNNLAMDEEWITKLKEEYASDPFYEILSNAIKTNDSSKLDRMQKTILHRFSLDNELLIYENTRAYLPPSLRKNAVQDCHDSRLASHPSAESTFQIVGRSYYWPKMLTDIKKYVKTCETCQMSKDKNHLPYGLLQPLPIPRDYWTSVSMDFITNLPKSRGYDSIMVAVCRLSKMVRCISHRMTDGSREIASLFTQLVIKNHGVPDEIITDRDSRFTSKEWKLFVGGINTSHKLSTAFHPETDGQTERANRTIGQTLRIFANYNQDNWSELLPFVEFSINNTPSATTKHTPFFLNYGRHPNMPSTFKIDNGTKVDINALKEWVKQSMKDAQDRQARYANTKRMEKEFAIGSKVMLKTDHYKDELLRGQRSKKLTSRFMGPFEILERIGRNAYRIKLPTKLRIHDVVNVSELEEFNDPSTSSIEHPEYSRPPPVFEEEYEVEEIIGKRVRRQRTQYLVKWIGYPRNESTWTDAADLEHAVEAIRDYELKQQTNDA